MPGTATNYYQAIRRAKNPNGKGRGKPVLVYNIKPFIEK